MTWSVTIIITLALGSIIGAIWLLKKSARKFQLTPEQLKKIKARNQALDKKQQQDDDYKSP